MSYFCFFRMDKATQPRIDKPKSTIKKGKPQRPLRFFSVILNELLKKNLFRHQEYTETL